MGRSHKGTRAGNFDLGRPKLVLGEPYIWTWRIFEASSLPASKTVLLAHRTRHGRLSEPYTYSQAIS